MPVPATDRGTEIVVRDWVSGQHTAAPNPRWRIGCRNFGSRHRLASFSNRRRKVCTEFILKLIELVSHPSPASVLMDWWRQVANLVAIWQTLGQQTRSVCWRSSLGTSAPRCDNVFGWIGPVGVLAMNSVHEWFYDNKEWIEYIV